MLLLILWIIGLVIAFGTKCEVELLTSNNRNIEERGFANTAKLIVCEFACIAILGGMPLGKWISNVPSALTLIDIVVLMIMAVVVYALMYFMLGLSHFKNKTSQICFIVFFVSSILIWNMVL